MSKKGKLPRNISKRAKSTIDGQSSFSTTKHLLLNYKDLSRNQGQSPEEWHKKNLLVRKIKFFRNIGNKSIIELQQQKTLVIYGNFPKKSEFTEPIHLKGNNWARLRVGSSARICGYVVGTNFYVVF